MQSEIDREVLKRLPPYVPKKTGALIESAEKSTIIGTGKIRYSLPYSRYQYYGVSHSGKALNYSSGGMRGAYWFERMKQNEKESILKTVSESLGVRYTVGTLLKSIGTSMIKQNPIKVYFGFKSPFF